MNLEGFEHFEGTEYVQSVHSAEWNRMGQNQKNRKITVILKQIRCKKRIQNNNTDFTDYVPTTSQRLFEFGREAMSPRPNTLMGSNVRAH